jgi:hypothetical protein
VKASENFCFGVGEMAPRIRALRRLFDKIDLPTWFAGPNLTDYMIDFCRENWASYDPRLAASISRDLKSLCLSPLVSLTAW